MTALCEFVDWFLQYARKLHPVFTRKKNEELSVLRNLTAVATATFLAFKLHDCGTDG